MKFKPIFFATPVYYEENQFRADADILAALLRGFEAGDMTQPSYVFSQADADSLFGLANDCIPVLIPMSGGTQKWVLQIAKQRKQALMWTYFPNDVLFGAEIQAVIERVCARNALPAVIDTTAHLKNRGYAVELVYDAESVQKKTGLFAALSSIRRNRLLVIGYTQQWVVSASVDQRAIEDRFGIVCSHIGLEELIEEYQATPVTAECKEFVASYMAEAASCVEPDSNQVANAYRMYLALTNLLKRYQCNGLSISCFSLVKNLGVTSCLALSLLNDEPGIIAACEGDLDSAVSMIIAKSLTGKPVYMGNPVFNRNNTLDLVHCTSARRLLSTTNQPYEVRSHHETGKSVAQRVEVAAGNKATIFRIGNEFQEATLYTAVLLDNPRQDTCRTQFRFALDSTDKRLDEVLGCHQLVIFGEYEELLRTAFAKYLGIAVR